MNEADRACAAYAKRRHGVIGHAAAARLGLNGDQIRYRLRSGRWEPLHPRVYALPGASDTWERSVVAAADWCGGWVSHRAGGRLYELPWCDRAEVEVTTHLRRFLTKPGVLVHHTDRLPEAQRNEVDGVPCTSIERTLLDLTWALPPRGAAAALDDALSRKLTDLQRLDHLLLMTARRGRRGTTLLREMIRDRVGEEFDSESPLESWVVGLIRDRGLPLPQQQYEVRDEEGFIGRIDLAYPEHRLLIEVQSRRYHFGLQSWRNDMTKMNRAVAAGYRVMQVTLEDIKQGAPTLMGLLERTLLP